MSENVLATVQQAENLGIEEEREGRSSGFSGFVLGVGLHFIFVS